MFYTEQTQSLLDFCSKTAYVLLISSFAKGLLSSGDSLDEIVS